VAGLNHRESAVAALRLASALRARGDTKGALGALGEAIAGAGASGDRSLLAAAHGNFGSLLSQIGRLDEAVANFDLALGYERDRRARDIVTMNKAYAMAALGELRAAAQVQRARA